MFIKIFQMKKTELTDFTKQRVFCYASSRVFSSKVRLSRVRAPRKARNMKKLSL